MTHNDADEASLDADAQISALAARYRSGDLSALEPLYNRLAPAIGGALGRYRSSALPPALSARDVEQQSWVALAEIARRWRPGGSFLGYFLRTFPREIRRYVLRASSHRRTRAVELLSVPHDEVIRKLDHTAARDPDPEDAIWWEQCLGALPPDERLAVTLRVLGGWDFAAIGEALRIRPASAHRMVRRALAAIPEAAGSGLGTEDSGLRKPPAGTEKTLTGDARAGDLVRLIAVLHRLAARDGTLPGRRRIGLVASFRRAELARLMLLLEAAGAIVDRDARRPGRLADSAAEATLARLSGRAGG